MGQLTRSGIALLTLCLALAWAQGSRADEGRWRAKPPPSTPPAAAAVDEARMRYAKALKLYRDEGAVEAALAELERAYDLAPSYKVLYNIGQAARTIRDYPLALHAFERYLADGGDQIRGDRRAEVLAEIKELRTFVSAVTVRVNVAGADVYVDDVVVGTSPLPDPVMVSAGRVTIRAVRGRAQDAKAIVVPGGDEHTVELSLVQPAGGAGKPTPPGNEPATEPATDGPEESTTASPYLWIGVAAAGAFAVGAAITGSVALSQSADLADQTYAGRVVPDDLDSQHGTVQALAITTDVFIGVAVTAAAVTGVLWLAGVGEQPAARDEQARRSPWSVRPMVALPGHGRADPRADRWGVAVTGEF